MYDEQRQQCETHDHLFDKIVKSVLSYRKDKTYPERIEHQDEAYPERTERQREAYQECYVAYLSNPDLPHDERMKAVEKHLKEWKWDKYVSNSDRERDGKPLCLSVNKIKPKPSQFYRQPPATSTILTGFHDSKPIFRDGWPGSGRYSGVYEYRRPRPTNSMETMGCRNPECWQEILDKGANMGFPAYYFDPYEFICWDCHFDNGATRLELHNLRSNFLNRLVENRTLTPRQAEIYGMWWLDALTQEQISEKKGTSLTNIENIINKALKRLGVALYSSRGEDNQGWWNSIRRYEKLAGLYKWPRKPTYAEQCDSKPKQTKQLTLEDKTGFLRPSQSNNYSVFSPMPVSLNTNKSTTLTL